MPIALPPPVMGPRVSVVMPTYNQAQYLPQALDSAMSQTYGNYELIVVNDGSTDDTRDVLESYQKRYAIRVIHQDNQRLPAALNTGFRAASGELLTWTSSDNVMLPDMLAELVAVLEANTRVGLVYADWEVVDESGAALRVVRTLDFDRHLLLRVNFVNACFMYRRTCQDVVGPYDDGFLYAEDWEYWLRIAERFPMQRVPKVLYRYREHAQSLSSSVVVHQSDGDERLQRMRRRVRRNLWSWYVSKLKWEWLRYQPGGDPRKNLTARG